MHIISIDKQYIFKTKSLYLDCYSVNSTVWRHIDELFLKSLGLSTEDYIVKNGICFIEIFATIEQYKSLVVALYSKGSI